MLNLKIKLLGIDISSCDFAVALHDGKKRIQAVIDFLGEQIETFAKPSNADAA